MNLCCWPGRSVARGHYFRLVDIGKCCEVEMNVEKTKVMKISKQPSPIQIVVDQKQPESVQLASLVSYLGSMITNDVRCTREIKFRIALAKAAFNEMRALFTSKLDLNLRKELVKCYI
jgi:hypothetical protein